MAVERAAGGTSLIDVLDRVLDKGIVIDAWVRVSLVGIDLITVEARVVVASIDTYLKYSEAVGQVAPLSPIQGLDLEAKLALVEFLLTSVDIQESARRAVDWLVAHAPVSEAAVLIIETPGNEMLLVAEHGMSSGAIMDFSLTRDDS